MVRSARDTDTDWKLVAEREPYWGVLSEDQFRGSALDEETHRRFMDSGESFVANLVALVRQHLRPDFSPQRALDVGCGVGRLLLPMARRATEAVGVDIAPAMLELTAREARRQGLNNVRLFPSDDTLSQVSGEFDLVNTYIVLQHIPPERGYRLIAAMLARMAIGGIGSIQMTYAKGRKFMAHEIPKADFYRREGNTLIDIVEADWQPPAGTITMFDYDLNQVMALVSRIAGHPVLALPTADDSHLGVHFVFQRAR